MAACPLYTATLLMDTCAYGCRWWYRSLVTRLTVCNIVRLTFSAMQGKRNLFIISQLSIGKVLIDRKRSENHFFEDMADASYHWGENISLNENEVRELLEQSYPSFVFKQRYHAIFLHCEGKWCRWLAVLVASTGSITGIYSAACLLLVKKRDTRTS